jgi:DNA ligase (NAD+)
MTNSELKLIRCIEKDLTYLNNLTQNKILNVIKYLSNEYYNNANSIVSDEIFDYIREYYETKTKKIIPVGAPIKNKRGAVILPYYMGSLDKIKPTDKSFEKWINAHPGKYCVSYKLDGMSMLITKNNGNINMYRRGDGIEAEDLSIFIKYINVNTSEMSDGDAIRGEVVFSKENFEKVKKILENTKTKKNKDRKYDQSRNVVSGLFSNKVPEEIKEILKYVDFVAYWVLSPEMKILDQMEYLEKKKMNVVDYIMKDEITVDYLSKKLINGREKYKYQIDGLVIVDNSQIYLQENKNPSFAFSFKQVMTDQIMESIVVDVVWEVSKDKYIKPRIKIEPITILNTKIEYATANNAKYIYDNKINVGTVVEMIKSNDIIPKINKILKESNLKKPKMPDIKYKWNDSGVDIIAIELDDETKNKVIVKQLMMFFNTFNVKEIGEGVLTKFVDNGYDNIFKILNAKKENLYDIDGLGEKSIEKIYNNIDEKLKDIKLYKLMTASQLLGRGIGDKKFKTIINDYPNIIDIYKDKGKDHVKKLLNTLEGFNDKTSNKIIDSFDEFIIYYNKLIKIKPNLFSNAIDNKKKEEPTNKKINKYKDKTIVFTGKKNKEIEKDLELIGAKVSSSVSNKTDIVVAKDITENTNKLNDARKYKVQIMSYDDFINSLK